MKQRCKKILKIKKIKKKNQKFVREREREITFFVREKYIKNGKENDKFIVRGCK